MTRSACHNRHGALPRMDAQADHQEIAGHRHGYAHFLHQDEQETREEPVLRDGRGDREPDRVPPLHGSAVAYCNLQLLCHGPGGRL